MKTILCLLVCIGCSGGSTEPAPDAPAVVDPIGTWSMIYTFSVDSCGHPSIGIPKTINVEQIGSNFVATVIGTPTPQTTDPGGSVICTAASCTIDITLEWLSADGTTSYIEPSVLTLDPIGHISGHGSETSTASSGSCTGQFTVTGTK